MAKTIQEIEVGRLRIDGDTQSRESMDDDTVDAYAKVYEDPDGELPPLDVVHDGEYYWPFDGFHRLFGAIKAGRTTVLCAVREGTLEDARWLCLAANKEFDTAGRRRTERDLRRAIELALWRRPGLTDGVIAGHVGASRSYVQRLRAELTCHSGKSPWPREPDATRDPEPEPPKRTGRDGRTTNTANIGRGRAQDGSGTGGAGGGGKQAGPKRDDQGQGKKREQEKEVKDDRGDAVPRELADVFADPLRDEALQTVEAWLKEVQGWDSLADRLTRRANAWPYARLSIVVDSLEKAEATLALALSELRAGRPYALCPTCRGQAQGCDDCRHCGHVPAWRHGELTGEVPGPYEEEAA